ncbi:MAG: hypothetical protein Q4A74_05000 [Cardiobacteriaceae bacterium]|nr:hypothetical protein [Cardiobacteriaceae bacterium]
MALINFIPGDITTELLRERAAILADIAFKYKADVVMIGGAPYFQSWLERAIVAQAMKYCYALTERKVREEINSDGTVTKTSVFEHAGFYISDEI